MDDLELVTKAIIEGDEETIVKSTKTLLDQKVSPE